MFFPLIYSLLIATKILIFFVETIIVNITSAIVFATAKNGLKNFINYILMSVFALENKTGLVKFGKVPVG